MVVAPPLRLSLSVRSGRRWFVFAVLTFCRFFRLLGRLELFVLAGKRRIFLRQTVHFTAQIRIVLFEFGHPCLKLLILLPSFRVLAGDQRQTKRHRQYQTSDPVLAHSFSPNEVAYQNGVARWVASSSHV